MTQDISDSLRKKISRQLLCLLYSLLLLFLCSPEGMCAGPVKDVPAPDGATMEDAAGDTKRETPDYVEGKTGWYWYKTESEEKEEPETDKPELAVNGHSYEKLWNMYPDDFQEMLDRTMKIAVQSPTEENVVNYLVMQDIARRKSVAFANVVGYVGQKHPQFSNADTHPVITPGRTALAGLKHDEITRTIEESSDEFALLMFTQEGCKFCDVQKSILKFFTSSHDWTVRPIDIDRHPDLASRFGIEQTPAIILIRKDSEDYMPISVGVISLNQLNTRIYRSIKLLRGDVTPEQWHMYDFEKDTGSDPLRFISLGKQKEETQ
ncbi:MAG: conjugal transfer protein TraF [Pseudomonadota bacterium]